MLDPAVAYVNVTGVFPDVVGVNASGPSATDGFEFVANFVNDNNLGIHQMILNHAGLTPNGVVESDSASQIKEALWKGFGAPPGVVTQWHLADDPGTSGHRALLLNGQGILRANYTELDAAVYVGDANNATADAYYRADDAAGTIRNIAGVYLILPETRGYVPRGLDTAASVDPDGASRTLGHLQLDAFQGHWHQFQVNTAAGAVLYQGVSGINSTPGTFATNGVLGPITDGVNGTPRTDSETRMVNFATKFVVWY